MILTDDDQLAEKARYLTTQAKDDPVRYVHNEIGYNFRLTNITEEQQAGRVGVTLSRPGKENTPVMYGSFRTTPFRIRRFRMITKNLRVKSPDSIVRIVAWNAARSLVMDQTYPLPGN